MKGLFEVGRTTWTSTWTVDDFISSRTKKSVPKCFSMCSVMVGRYRMGVGILGLDVGFVSHHGSRPSHGRTWRSTRLFRSVDI